MRRKDFSVSKLYCFSPPVMIATFVIEIILMVYTIARYHLTAIGRVAAALLICLAVFQLAEYNVCEAAFGLDSLTWSRIGYVAITILPPLGIHLISLIARRSNRYLVLVSYAVAAIFASYFLLIGHGISGNECLGNYVIFQVARDATILYSIYYWGLLSFGVLLALNYAKREPHRQRSRALSALAFGYLAFMVPTLLVNLLDRATLAAIPSIMCGFAILLAVILVGEVLPNAEGRKSFLQNLPSIMHSETKLNKLLRSFMGWIVLIGGIIMIPYPGPGWVVVFIGLTILSKDYPWAARLLGYARDKYDRWNAWVIKQPRYVRVVLFVLTTLIVVVTLWLLNVYGTLDNLLNLGLDWVHSPFDR